MPEIKVLDQNTRDQIAAGEVAERPAFIIKELVENSIDAGADRISVILKDGGIGRIRVIDNGCGIDAKEIPTAFLRHATSKLRNISDLDSLYTMGFRGEALASIAAVSKVRLISKTKDSESAFSLTVEGGEQGEVIPAAGNQGTEIIIEDLFYNTPARKKFLATPVREMREIASLLGKIIIANPGIRFEVENNGKKVYLSPGDNIILNAIKAVYGEEMADRLVPLKDNSCFSGYVSHPEYSKSTRNYFHFYINDRYIQSNLLNKTVEDSYNTLLSDRRFPCVFINIKLDPGDYDINVHPNKLDIKFRDNDYITDTLKSLINNSLTGLSRAYGLAGDRIKENINISIDLNNNNDKTETGFSPAGRFFGSSDPLKIHQDLPLMGLPGAVEQKKQREAEERKSLLREASQKSDACKEASITSSLFKTKEYIDPAKESSILSAFMSDSDSVSVSVSNNNINDNNLNNEIKKAKDADESLFKEGFYQSLELLGQLSVSFIVAADKDNLYLIDQHAAHERLLFNKICGSIKYKKIFSQQLLVPLPFNPNQTQFYWILEHIILLNELGFVLEEFGEQSFVVREVPFWAEDIDVIAFLEELTDSCYQLKEEITPAVILERKLATKACKAAVKANMRLTEESIKELFKELDASDNAYTCPHGRPICIKYSVNEIRHKFLRS